MHDFSLGPPVDTGEYCGPMLDGKPLHQGNCEDGVYGCRGCNGAARRLTDEELAKIGWPTHGRCDFCKTEVRAQELVGHKAHDEPCYYQICLACKKRDNEAAERELAEIQDRYGDDW